VTERPWGVHEDDSDPSPTTPANEQPTVEVDEPDLVAGDEPAGTPSVEQDLAGTEPEGAATEVAPALETGPAAEAEPEPETSALPEPALEPAEPEAAPVAEAPEPAEPEAAHVVEAPPEPTTVSAEVARWLHGLGVRICFTVPGESFLPLLDDLEAAGVRVVVTRHEGGASFMAEALSQLTGRPQMVLVTRTVGAANAAIGIHAARQDSVPVVAVVGQVERAHLGREAFQESDLVGGIGRLATWAGQIDDPARAHELLDALATHVTHGRPGPVLLAVPEDVLAERIDSREGRAPGMRRPAPDPAAVRTALKWLAASERGVILAGGGVLRARASRRLVALAETLAVPVMASWRRPDVFPNDHPLYLGMTGYASASTVRERLEDADVVLVLGARLSEVASYEYAFPHPGQRWIHADLDPRVAHAGLTAPDLAIASDALRFIDSALALLRGAALDAEMRDRRTARAAADHEAWLVASDVSRGTWEGPGVHPGRAIATLRAVLPENAIVTSDAGNIAGWLARGFRFTRPGTFLGPASGAMGFGLPAAIAASLHEQDRVCVVVCGDGGFAMTMSEMETAVREDARPIVLVFDNIRYGTIAMHQAHAGRPTRTSELGPIDFASYATAVGAFGVRVDSDAMFEPALREAIASRRPAVLHIALDPAWVSVDETPILDG
jgi:acetolactate synthase I/II/III large subunit